MKARGNRIERAEIVSHINKGDCTSGTFLGGIHIQYKVSLGEKKLHGMRGMKIYRTPKRDWGDKELHRAALKSFVDLTGCRGLSIKNVAAILGVTARSIRHWDSVPSDGRGGRIGSVALIRMIRLSIWVREGQLDLRDVREIRWKEGEISRWDDTIYDHPVGNPPTNPLLLGWKARPFKGLRGDSPYRQFCELVGKDALGGGRLIGLSSRQEGRARDLWHNYKRLDARFLARIVILLGVHYNNRAAAQEMNVRSVFVHIFAVNWTDGLIRVGKRGENAISKDWIPVPLRVRQPQVSLLHRMRRISESRAGTWEVPKSDDVVQQAKAAMRLDPNRHRILKPYIPEWKYDRVMKHRMLRSALGCQPFDLRRELDVYRNRIKSRNQERNQDSVRQKRGLTGAIPFSMRMGVRAQAADGGIRASAESAV